MASWGTMTRRAIGRVIAGFLLLATPVMAAESPAELISSYRLKHGEVRVVRDATLDRIALEQARATSSATASWSIGADAALSPGLNSQSCSAPVTSRRGRTARPMPSA